jgi:hypothetical protein
MTSMLAVHIEAINKLIAGPGVVELDGVCFVLQNSALSALRLLDQAFDMPTSEDIEEGQYFSAWRNLKVGGMEIRFRFSGSTQDFEFGSVSVHGLKSRSKRMNTYFSEDHGDELFVHFLRGIVPFSKDHLTAVGMGQHDRLGAGSPLSTLPDGILQHLMQPLIATLEHWDRDKEATLIATIEQQYIELTKAYIDKVVASVAYDEENRGISFEGALNCHPYTIHGMCAELDARFGMLTEEPDDPEEFSASRLLSINGKQVYFTFEADMWSREEPYIHVKGLGHVEGAAEHNFHYKAYTYFLDALLRSGHAAVLTVTSDE